MRRKTKQSATHVYDVEEEVRRLANARPDLVNEITSQLHRIQQVGGSVGDRGNVYSEAHDIIQKKDDFKKAEDLKHYKAELDSNLVQIIGKSPSVSTIRELASLQRKYESTDTIHSKANRKWKIWSIGRNPRSSSRGGQSSSYQSSQAVQPTQPTQSVQPAQPTQSTQPAQPAQPSLSAGGVTKLLRLDQPAEVGYYVDVLSYPQKLYQYSTSPKEALTDAGTQSPPLNGITEELKEQARLYARLNLLLLIDLNNYQLVYWDRRNSSNLTMKRTALPSDLTTAFGKLSEKYLIEPISKNIYMYSNGYILPFEWRGGSDIHPNHMVAAGILRQIEPPMLFFYDKQNNQTYYFRYGGVGTAFNDSRLISFNDSTAQGVRVFTSEILLPTDSTTFNKIMATSRIKVQRTINTKKGCL